jgi:1,4-alpha-glucan branching enzyme
MPRGYLAIVLHAHLPFVRHPDYESFLEERWLYEAITETYIPLLRYFERLVEDRVESHVTVSLSPTLISMLEDPLLQERYDDHVGKLVALAERELDRTRYDPHLNWLAGMYRDLFVRTREYFQRHGGRLSRPLLRLHELGVVELVTTAATHGILPLLLGQPKTVEAQLSIGFEYFQSVFGFRPSGMWLPECAYCPELEQILRRHDVRYIVLESHGIDHATPTPWYGVHAPIYTPSGVAAFGRDQGSTKEVWSAQQGFPGDPDYREFYRDIGFDLDFDYIRSVMGFDVRAMTGIKYHRITGRTPHKRAYDPEVGRHTADVHAQAFMDRRAAHIDALARYADAPPIIVAPFDAELFGHWWFEGPQWLDYFIRKSVYDQDKYELTTLDGYLDQHPVHLSASPGTSTWGHGGYFETWINGRVDWIYNHLTECAERMQELATTFYRAGHPASQTERALNQCVRELLLAQSSDWPFIISQGTSSQYAERRVRDHVARFHFLACALESGRVDEESLRALEYVDNLFPELDYRLFAEPVATRPC